MDRFVWSDGLLAPEEQLAVQQMGVSLYDGDTKTAYKEGRAVLTTHNLIWRHSSEHDCILSLPLSYVIFTDEEASGFYKSAKIVLHVEPCDVNVNVSKPVSRSSHSYIKLSFKEGGQKEFLRCLNESLAYKKWKYTPKPLDHPGAASGGTGQASTQTRKTRAGIVGIERNIQKKNQETDKNISVAFEDLSKLMVKAKEMVNLSNKIAGKIKDKQGDITEDETIKFKSYLLSLGVADPVTRETHGTGSKYYKELAKQISNLMTVHIQDAGGVMTMTDAYCRINRARGMELLSPEDLINACKQMEYLALPIRLKMFDSGVMVLQLNSHKESEILKQTEQVVSEKESLTADELSRLVGISVVLSKERLLAAEKLGTLCRDETVEGLRFYPNMFLCPPVS